MIDLQPLAAPLLALLGTLVVALLGFYQWRRQHSNPNRVPTAEARRKAIEALWTKAEEINLAMRRFGKDARPVDVSENVKSLNELFIRNSLYLDDSLQRKLADYVELLHKASARLAEYNEGRDEWSNTSIQPPEKARQRKVWTAVEAANAKRAEIKAKLLASIDA